MNISDLRDYYDWCEEQGIEMPDLEVEAGGRLELQEIGREAA